MYAEPDNSNRSARASLYMGVAFGLAFEICCLAGFLLTWMANREIPVQALWAPGDVTPLADLPVTATRTSAASLLVPSPVSVNTPALSTETVSTASPAMLPTSTWQPPVFTDLPAGKIVYTCFDGNFDQICLMNADGSDKRQLTDEPATSFYPSLSPDGQAVVFSSNRDGNFEIFWMDISNYQDVVQLTQNMGNLYAPEISPRNNRIAFTHESAGVQSIWVMKMDGRNPHPLFQSSGKDVDPTWSPDGLRLAFGSTMNGPTGIFVVGPEETDISPVTPAWIETGGRSSWSPDGFRLAYYAGGRGDHNIFTISLDGSNPQQWTNGGDNLAPSYSPDGRWLAFTSYRDGNNEIYILDLASQMAYRLTSAPTSDWQPRWGP